MPANTGLTLVRKRAQYLAAASAKSGDNAHIDNKLQFKKQTLIQ